MFVVVREQLFGENAAPDPFMFWLGYGAYIFIPALVMLRVAFYPVFALKKLHKE